jgi:uncharacterized protein (DUF1697 family)
VTSHARARGSTASGAPERHVALLRGINVGRAKRIAMADLRALVTDLGYHDVRTLLNSGNVVFGVSDGARADIAQRLEQAITKHLGVSSRVTVLSAVEVATAVADNPLLDVANDPSRLFVSVLTNPADRAKLMPLARRDWTPEAFAIGARVGYIWCPAGMTRSPLSKAVGDTLGDTVTTRNWATMTKLHALLGGRAPS